MKKIIPILAIVIVSLSARGQATLLQTFSGNNPANVVLFSSNGEKIYYSDTVAVYLYYMNCSLWKTITFPSMANYVPWGVYNVSDNLFNSDNLVEVGLVYEAHTGTYPQFKNVIINETGSILQNLDTTYEGTVHYDDSTNSYQLFTYIYSDVGGSFKYYTNIYSLPGIMPCGLCGNLGTENVTKSNTAIQLSDPVPNPSDGSALINYVLPPNSNSGMLIIYNMAGNIIKQLPVFSSQNDIRINTATLIPGSYSYNLVTDNITSPSRVLIVK